MAESLQTPETDASPNTLPSDPKRPKLLAAITSTILAVGAVVQSGSSQSEPKPYPSPTATAKNAPTKTSTLFDKELRLDNYKTEAAQALTWVKSSIDTGDTERMHKCLEKLEQWRNEEIVMHGPPEPSNADGLVISQPVERTQMQDFYECVTKAIEQLHKKIPAQDATARRN